MSKTGIKLRQEDNKAKHYWERERFEPEMHLLKNRTLDFYYLRREALGEHIFRANIADHFLQLVSFSP